MNTDQILAANQQMQNQALQNQVALNRQSMEANFKMAAEEAIKKLWDKIKG